MKKLIISCDDLGISKEVNLGIKDCLQKKAATSTSIIANGKFYDHALENVVTTNTQSGYGLHLNLTEGKALNKNSIDILCDKNNDFKISALNFFLLNLYGVNNNLKKAVYEELKSQIQKVLKDGIKLSHLDSHEHIHHAPWIFNIIADLGKEFKINKIRFVNEKIILKNYFKNFFYKVKSLNYFKHLLISTYKIRIKNDLLSPDYFFGILNSGNIKKDEFFYFLKKIQPNTTIELCIHPANQTESEDASNLEQKYRNFYSNKNRTYEKFFLFSDEFSDFIKRENIKLISFLDLN